MRLKTLNHDAFYGVAFALLVLGFIIGVGYAIERVSAPRLPPELPRAPAAPPGNLHGDAIGGLARTSCVGFRAGRDYNRFVCVRCA